MKIYKFNCPYCDAEYRGKSGFDKCTRHIDRKHPSQAGHYPINHSVEFVDGKWVSFIP